jgi:hypothetical protein
MLSAQFILSFFLNGDVTLLTVVLLACPVVQPWLRGYPRTNSSCFCFGESKPLFPCFANKAEMAAFWWLIKEIKSHTLVRLLLDFNLG